MIRLKPGASVDGTRPVLWWGVAIAAQVFEAHGADLVITSGTDGVHKPGSIHYEGEAFDARSHSLPDEIKSAVLVELGRALGPDWDVILEHPDGPDEHYHLEHDPRPRFRTTPV
jgi:hypothetical protein